MGHKEIKMVCYTDDMVLAEEKEDDLLRIFHEFNFNAKNINMKIFTQKP